MEGWADEGGTRHWVVEVATTVVVVVPAVVGGTVVAGAGSVVVVGGTVGSGRPDVGGTVPGTVSGGPAVVVVGRPVEGGTVAGSVVVVVVVGGGMLDAGGPIPIDDGGARCVCAGGGVLSDTSTATIASTAATANSRVNAAGPPVHGGSAASWPARASSTQTAATPSTRPSRRAGRSRWPTATMTWLRRPWRQG